MSTITAAELQQRLTAQPDLILLDVRTPAEFDEVHVPQARLEPLDLFQSSSSIAVLALPKDKPIYLLCQSGGRATSAASKLKEAGYEKATVVEGGTLAWIKAGLPVTRGERKAIGLERQVRIAAGSLVLVGVILSLVVHPAFIGLSGFVGAGLVFAGITDWCGMGLLLAKAPWNQRRSA